MANWAIPIITAVIIGPIAGYLLRAFLPQSPSKKLITVLVAVVVAAMGAVAAFALQGRLSTEPLLLRIQSEVNQEPISQADATLELVGAIAPLREVSDSDGYARFLVPRRFMGSPARVIVRASGYVTHIANIEITSSPPTLVVPMKSLDIPQEPLAPEPSSGSPIPTSLPPVFDDFPVCIDSRLWSRTRPIPGAQVGTRPYCVQLESTPTVPYAFADNGKLIISALTPWQDGITLRQLPDCQFDEVAVMIDTFAIQGRAWIGLIVDHPQRSPGVIAVWYGRIGDATEPITVVTNQAESPTSSTSNPLVLMDNVATDAPAVLSVRFDGQRAHPTFVLGDSTVETAVQAAGYPYNFSFRYWVGETSSLSAVIDAVRVFWRPAACGFPVVPGE